jgi:hypothetical protein
MRFIYCEVCSLVSNGWSPSFGRRGHVDTHIALEARQQQAQRITLLSPEALAAFIASEAEFASEYVYIFDGLYE